MIQRIQSVFLFLIVACLIAMLFFPIWVKGEIGHQQVVLNAFQLVHEDLSVNPPKVLATKSTAYIFIIAVIGACIALFSIFQYRNRMLQMKLGLLNSLVMAVLVICALIVAGNMDTFMGENYPRQFKVGVMLPIGGLIFNSLANRFIRRDEKLVRDSDRVR